MGKICVGGGDGGSAIAEAGCILEDARYIIEPPRSVALRIRKRIFGESTRRQPPESGRNERE